MSSRVRQLKLKECYEILRLEKGASLEDLKKSYRKRAFELHPDLNPGNPAAARDFQLLNEAYVALSAVLKPRGESGQKDQGKEQKREQGKDQGKDQAQDQTSKKSAHEAAGEYEKQSKAGGPSQTYTPPPKSEQDVLRDLLNDPFARRVFEDIYSELGKKQAQPQAESKPQPKPASPPPKKEVVSAPRAPEKGVKGAVKGWLRRQIDEEQTLKLPKAYLAPGRKVRLQIRQGLSEELKTVEITLPPDFVAGKPIRLRGLGKHVGPWQGDLYLTINNE